MTIFECFVSIFYIKLMNKLILVALLLVVSLQFTHKKVNFHAEPVFVFDGEDGEAVKLTPEQTAARNK